MNDQINSAKQEANQLMLRAKKEAFMKSIEKLHNEHEGFEQTIQGILNIQDILTTQKFELDREADFGIHILIDIRKFFKELQEIEQTCKKHE